MNKVLDVQNLHVSFDTYAGEVKAVRGVTFSLSEGEVLAIVGESGCGKSVTAQTIMKLNPMPPARIKEGSVQLGEHDIVAANEKEMQKIRGKEVSMIFQDPMTCLNPTKPVGKQIVEAIQHHRHLSKAEAKAEAIKYLSLVNIPNPEERAKQYPHEFSGGMRQRAMIAMALSCNPKLIAADSVKEQAPEFNVGDTIRIDVNIREGERERIQQFEGTVIARKGSGVGETFTVRRVSYGVGVERVFPLHSPNVKNIVVVRKGRVRRAKLYYLRDRVGKAAKVKSQVR